MLSVQVALVHLQRNFPVVSNEPYYFLIQINVSRIVHLPPLSLNDLFASSIYMLISSPMLSHVFIKESVFCSLWATTQTFSVQPCVLPGREDVLEERVPLSHITGLLIQFGNWAENTAQKSNGLGVRMELLDHAQGWGPGEFLCINLVEWSWW